MKAGNRRLIDFGAGVDMRDPFESALASGCSSRQHAGVERFSPLVDESSIGSASSAKPLLLDALDLDNDAVLDDHTDLTIPDAADSSPDAVQIEICRGRQGESSFVVLRVSCIVRHVQLHTLAERTGSQGGEFYQ
jgi:hypothetical protein